MLVVLLVLLAATGFAQTGQDALPLLREVAEASRNLTTYRAEGRIAQDLDVWNIPGKRDLLFHIATRSPQQMRIEVADGPEWMGGVPYTAVCNGREGSVYYAKGKTYWKVTAGNFRAAYCMPGTLTSFEHVADDVKSAVIIGVGSVHFEGRAQPCVEVQALYRVIKDVMVPPALVLKIGHVSRRMCIDRSRKLILRDRIEAYLDGGPEHYHILETVIYDRIERNPDLPATLFDFQPPEGATFSKDAEPLPDTGPPPAAPPSGPTVYTRPMPIAPKEPEYSQEAWDEGIQGKVILLPDIDPDGTIRDVAVRQSLGYGLDEKAIECVRKWRFNPATLGDKPVKGTAWVEFHFSLPDERPARPSPSPVSRPVPPPRLPISEPQVATDLDHFFYAVALLFSEPAACQKIHPLADGGGGNDRGDQIRSLQSKCYFQLATALHNARLCDRVKPIKTEYQDGSKFDRAYCIERLSDRSTFLYVDPLETEAFVRLMRSLGYDDRRVAEFAPGEYAAYRKIRTEREFLDRVQAAPSYAEARLRARIRPAHAAEFIYQMVAIETQDAGLCAKVSPNATFVDTAGRTTLLRSNCYRALAWHMRDRALCESLPRAGTFPYVNSAYDSREVCQETVAIYQRPEFKNESLDYGPAEFPHASYFEKGLLQIGYTEAYVGSLVPKPTPTHYWEFLEYLARPKNAQERVEFLRRAMSLK